MPSVSRQQQKFVYAKRAQYGSREKAPEKWKWVFDKEWSELKKEFITPEGDVMYYEDKRLLRYRSKFREFDETAQYYKYWQAVESLFKKITDFTLDVDDGMCETSLRINKDMVKGCLKYESYFGDNKYDVKDVDKMNDSVLSSEFEKSIKDIYEEYVVDAFNKQFHKEYKIDEIKYRYSANKQLLYIIIYLKPQR